MLERSRVVARKAGARPGPPIAGQGDTDDGRIEPAQGVVRQPQALGLVATQVAVDGIGRADQALEVLLA